VGYVLPLTLRFVCVVAFVSCCILIYVAVTHLRCCSGSALRTLPLFVLFGFGFRLLVRVLPRLGAFRVYVVVGATHFLPRTVATVLPLPGLLLRYVTTLFLRWVPLLFVVALLFTFARCYV